MDYTDEELTILSKITLFMCWLIDHECRNFRTKEETIQLIKQLLNSLRWKEKILLFALFCPSYKKGKGVIGFNTEIGETTRQGIDVLSKLRVKLESLGFSYDARAIFCDLALENFNQLTAEDMGDLELNFNAFAIYGEKKDSTIKYLKLSEIGNSLQRISMRGISQGEVLLNNAGINRIVRRSAPFYEGILGWKKEEIVKRTEDLARSCSAMCAEIVSENSSAFMVMTENIYERARFYGVARKLSLPIFYPKKYDKLKVVIVGGPLSGKSTLGARLAKLMKVPHISTGRLIDSHFKRNGLTINHVDTTPSFKDETLVELIKNVLDENRKEGFVLEGFPKYLEEFSLFEKICLRVDIVIILPFNEQISKQRLQGRRICSRCANTYNTLTSPSIVSQICDSCKSDLIVREDDTEDIFNIRVNEYLKLEQSLIDFITSKAKRVVYLDSTIDVRIIDLEVLNEHTE